MIKTDIELKIKFLHGLSNKTRIQILECIKEKEKTVSQIVDEVKASQSNISQHLTCLKECGLIVSRQKGKYVFYRLKSSLIKDLLTSIDIVLQDIQNNIVSCEYHFDDGGKMNG